MPVPLIVPTTESGGGASGTLRASLKAYRRALASALGPFGVYPITGAATGGDAARAILSSGLADDQEARDYFAGSYAYVATGAQAGNQRTVLAESYEGPLGSLLVSSPFAAVLAIGSEVELSSPLPAKRHLNRIGLNDLVNEALRALPVIHRVALVATSESTTGQAAATYRLDSLPFPVRGVTEVYGPVSTANGLPRPTGQRWSFRQDAHAPTLELTSPFAVGKTFWVDLVRPADTWIKSGAAWGDSTVGLSGDSDLALYDVDTVVNQAKPLAYERLANLFPPDSKERAEYLLLARDAHRVANWSRFYSSFRRQGGMRVGAR